VPSQPAKAVACCQEVGAFTSVAERLGRHDVAPDLNSIGRRHRHMLNSNLEIDYGGASLTEEHRVPKPSALKPTALTALSKPTRKKIARKLYSRNVIHRWFFFTVFPVVGAAVPAAVCRWGLARAVLMWGGVTRGQTS